MAETIIVYNGIEIRDVLTEDITQTLIKEATGVDPLYIETSVTVTGIIHNSAQLTQIGIRAEDYGAADTAGAYNDAVADLLVPRKNFTMTMGGSTLFDVSPAHLRSSAGSRPGTAYDVNNGPVTSVRVLNITSANTMRIQLTVRMAISICLSRQTGAISFRFWIADDIDARDWTTVRTYHGRLIVSDLTQNVFLTLRDHFRMPPLQDGFARESITLNQSPNGLELEFTVRDRELWAVAPYPATDWDGYYAVNSPLPGGVQLFTEMYLSLAAPKDVDKRLLLKLAVRMFNAKLHYEDLIVKQQAWLESFSFRESLKENSIEGNMNLKQMSETFAFGAALNGLGLPLDKLKKPLDNYDSQKATLGSTTASIKGLFLAALNDPCHLTGFPPSTPGQQGERLIKTQRGQPNQTTINDQGATLQPEQNDYSQQHLQEGMFNLYKMASDTDIRSGQIALPVGTRKNVNDPSLAVIDMHQGYATRRVRIEAERLGAWPTLPKPESFTDDKDVGHTLLRAKVFPSAPRLDPHGKKTMYHVIYELVFALSKVPSYSKGEISAGLAPYRKTGQNNEIFFVPAKTFADAKGFLYTGGSQ